MAATVYLQPVGLDEILAPQCEKLHGVICIFGVTRNLFVQIAESVRLVFMQLAGVGTLR
jgi:hypothetical protein